MPMTGLGFSNTYASNADSSSDSGGSGGSGGTPFSVTLDVNGESTLDVTVLGLTTTTGKQISGLAPKYIAGSTFVTAELYWETLDATHFYIYSTAAGVQETLEVTGNITDV